MAQVFKTVRTCAGEYRVTDGARYVEVSQMNFCDGPGWVASAEWDHMISTDPLRTKRDAVMNARFMLQDAAKYNP